MSVAEQIYAYIVRDNRFGIKQQILGMDDAELKTFVNDQCDKLAPSIMVGGNINSYVDTTIDLPLKTHLPLENMDDLKNELHQAVEDYLNNIMQQLPNCKDELYKRLQKYRVDEQPSAFK